MILAIWISETILTLAITAFIHGYTDGVGIPFPLSWEESPLPFFVACAWPVALPGAFAYYLGRYSGNRAIRKIAEAQERKRILETPIKNYLSE